MNHRRRGVSLTEMLVVMSAASVVLTLTSSLLCRVLRVQSDSQVQQSLERDALRLSQQFRRDVHRAEQAFVAAENEAEGVLLRLDLADGECITYLHRDGELVRQRVAVGGQAGREEFRFPVGTVATLQKLAAPPRLSLTLTAPPLALGNGADQPPVRVQRAPVALQVESELGRDLHLTSAPPHQEPAE